MQPIFREIFGDRLYGTEFLRLYKDMANTYTGDTIEQLYQAVEQRDTPMSFSEINAKVAAFNNELINRATWIREDYKENKGYSSPKLTRGCKKIISQCVKEYLRAIQLANRTGQFDLVS